MQPIAKTFNLNKPLSFKWFLSWGAILAGAFLVSLSFVLFITPYKYVPGGVYGIGIMLNSFFPSVKVGTFGLMQDIPLLILSFIIFGRNFGSKTVVAAIVTPLIMNALTTLIGSDPATMLGGRIDLSNDILLASIFGGVIMGVGLGLIFKNQATSGGTDIIAMIAAKYLHLPLSRAIIIVEGTIVILGGFVFSDWKLPLYAIVCIFVYTRVIDFIIEGAGSEKLIFIISKKHEQMKEYILNVMERGGTYIKAKGMYTNDDKEIIFVVVSRREIFMVRSLIKKIDPEAFTVIVDANETIGDGFKPINTVVQ